MTTHTKIYVGKGKQIGKFDLCNVVIDMDLAKQHTFIGKNGRTFLAINVAKTKNVDAYGRTHTAYVSVKNEVPNAVQEPEPVKKTSRKKAAKA